MDELKTGMGLRIAVAEALSGKSIHRHDDGRYIGYTPVDNTPGCSVYDYGELPAFDTNDVTVRHLPEGYGYTSEYETVFGYFTVDMKHPASGLDVNITAFPFATAFWNAFLKLHTLVQKDAS